MCVCVVQEERTQASQGFVIAFESYSKRADSSQGFVIAFKSYSRKVYACIDMGSRHPQVLLSRHYIAGFMRYRGFVTISIVRFFARPK
jgi:hypothetical protein